MRSFLCQNGPIVLNDFFWKIHSYNFHLPLYLFYSAKSLKTPWNGPRVIRIRSFWAQNGSFALDFLFRKTINSTFMYRLVSFILENLKKILRVDPEL